MERSCRNCNAALAGRYCAACGQKAFEDADRHFIVLLRSFFAELTSIDGRFWRSLAALMVRPGLLSREYLAGRRQRYLTPITLFLLANAIYFLSPGLSDFNLSLVDQTLQAHSRWTRPLLDAKLAARGLAFNDFKAPYELAASNVGKLLLIVHVPFIALALMLGALRTRPKLYFGEHFVVALHLFTFLLLYIQFFSLAESLGLGQVINLRWLGWLELYGPCVYFLLAVRRAYGSNIGRALLTTVAVTAALVAGNLFVYRSLQFVIALAIA